MSHSVEMDGGPAFPGKWPQSFSLRDDGTEKIGYRHEKGMSLRDWFATHAMKGFATLTHNPNDYQIGVHADLAYRYADAMIAHRSKQP